MAAETDDFMKRSSIVPTPIEWGVIVFGIWHSRDLIHAWRDSPRDHGGAIIFGLWLLPLTFAWVQDRTVFGDGGQLRTRVSILAIVTILAGAIGELNALVYCGLALAVTTGTFQRSIPLALSWCLASVTWMPALSYATNALPNTIVMTCKFGFVITVVLFLFIHFRKPSLT